MPLKKLFSALLFLSFFANAQNPVLIGYWQNWNDGAAPYIPLDQVDPRYDVICVAFAIPVSPTDMNMTFSPDGTTQENLISQIQTLQSQGKKVLISIGGADASVSLDNIANRDAFVASMATILNTYHFDGVDIDIEHGNSILASGTIDSPTNFDEINFMYALSQIRSNYFSHFSQQMMLTFAPETAYVQGGMSAFGGIWGGYLPIIDYFRNELSYIHVQLYNSGSMYGIDGAIYNQGTADFIIAMTEATIQGFDTAGGHFAGLPSNKVAIGLPACPSAAGGGFATTEIVSEAVNYLRGTGPKPGSYTLVQNGGYPNIGGLMDWSINWDKVATCNATSYEYALNFENLFPMLSTPQFSGNTFSVAPNPVKDKLYFSEPITGYRITNIQGQIVKSGTAGESVNVDNLKSGLYFLASDATTIKFVKE